MGKNTHLGMQILLLFCMLLVVNLSDNCIFYAKTSSASQNGVQIRKKTDDKVVIPDKYNTGASGKLNKVKIGDKIKSIELINGNNGTKNVLDFYYKNSEIKGKVVLNNLDFSDYPLVLYHADKVEHKIEVTFKNCKFSHFAGNRKSSNITFKFERCSFYNFYGSDATFNRCKFGKSFNDGLNPFQNVIIKNCFFTDFGSMKSKEAAVHTDGTQIYGWKDIDVKNIVYENCRFEIPPVASAGSKAGVNACIMLQLEFSNAENIKFQDCILNGGGYSIYAESKYDNFEMKNVFFDNIRLGCAKKYGNIYPKVSSNVSFSKIKETDRLYIGSVWKKKGKTYLSVSNDTCRKRKLLVITDKGKFRYTIGKCKNGKQMNTNDKYKNMPFDKKIVIPQNCKYVICYDNTFSGAAKQIRFVNWSEKNVYITKKEKKALFSGKKDIIASGKCGKNVKYMATKDGVLTLKGKGATYSYNSQKSAPWENQADMIKCIKVQSGITKLGNQLFMNCNAVQKVSISQSVKVIGSRTFYGCTCLRKLKLPKNIKSIGDKAFSTWTKVE